MYEVGAESGRYYSVNVPLKEGIDDQSEFNILFNSLFFWIDLFHVVYLFISSYL